MQIEKKKSSRPQWFSAIRFVLVCVGPSGWKKAFKCCIHNLPTKVAVAVASLTYASSRCGELSLLHLIRNLFRERYGRDFDITNVELFAGNYVNLELRKNLSIYSVSDDEKLMLLHGIIQEYTSPL
ncbi:uncharacterized protein LOC109792078 isoform X1 [Cajanus cajan]|uniref:uncharacterized protein LOC109792078 isoform X1 n=1 Tax=Cajanus cajan TaxID=3821 RepID=UPI0010FAF002|nr:uncharacterized protein LOC109792078 isoform X1 [Cajanus cajan]